MKNKKNKISENFQFLKVTFSIYLKRRVFVMARNEFSMSIIHCNIRSIRRKLEYIRESFMDFDIL